MAELDALTQRIAAMKDLLQRRCQCADLEECGRRLILKRRGLGSF
jgi:hypothetical protein